MTTALLERGGPEVSQCGYDSRQAVINAELAWHEQEAQGRYKLDAFLYDPPAFDAIVEAGLSFLQLRPGEQVLELGCGEGKETLAMALTQGVVVAIDLSYVQLCRARQLVLGQCPGACVCFIQANAEQLPFRSASFRAIYGKAILHHLHLDLSAHEITRVLQPGGLASFAEPMANHPLFWLARRLTPRLRTRDEHPLSQDDLDRFAARFAVSEVDMYFLITPVVYALRSCKPCEPLFRRFHGLLQQVDTRIMLQFPSSSKLAWYSLLKISHEV